MLPVEINVDGREIISTPRSRTSPAGLVLKPDGLQGWQGLPAGRREALARAVEHGEHDVPVFLPSRVVTIDAWVLAEDEFDLGERSEAVLGIGSSGDRIRTTVSMYGTSRWADGRRLLCEFDDSGIRNDGMLYGSFQLQLVFADPRRYGESNTFPREGIATSISAGHYGNFPAFPVIEIPSAPAAYTITSAGRVFTVTGATAGGTHTVDLRRGRVYRNGVEMPSVGRGDLWTAPPGVATAFVLSVAGRVKLTNTYI